MQFEQTAERQKLKTSRPLQFAALISILVGCATQPPEFDVKPVVYKTREEFIQETKNGVIDIDPLVQALTKVGGQRVGTDTFLPEVPKDGLIRLDGSIKSDWLFSYSRTNQPRYQSPGLPLRWVAKFWDWCTAKGGFLPDTTGVGEFLTSYASAKGYISSSVYCLNLSAFQKFRIDDKIAELTLIRPNYNANMPPTHYAGHLVIQTRQSIVGTYPLVNPAVSARIIESQKPVEQSPNEFDALRQSRSKIP